jgi:hypothetical protein
VNLAGMAMLSGLLLCHSAMISAADQITSDQVTGDQQQPVTGTDPQAPSPDRPAPDNSLRDSTAMNLLVEKAFLGCSGTEIRMTTLCLSGQGCFSQDISFVNRRSSRATTISYPHSVKGGNQTFITNVICMKTADSLTIMLESTNFDSCETCAWWDVFTSDGDYIGSSPGMLNDGPFVWRKLPDNIAQGLFSEAGRVVVEIGGLNVMKPRFSP